MNALVVLTDPTWIIRSTFWEMVDEPDQGKPLVGWIPPIAFPTFEDYPTWLQALNLWNYNHWDPDSDSPAAMLKAESVDILRVMGQLIDMATLTWESLNREYNIKRFRDGYQTDYQFSGFGSDPPPQAHIRFYCIYTSSLDGLDYVQMWESRIDFELAHMQYVVTANVSPFQYRSLLQDRPYTYINNDGTEFTGNDNSEYDWENFPPKTRGI